jgi:hypothetical protein
LCLPDRWGEKRWKQSKLDLLGTAPDAELAVRLGRNGERGVGNAEPDGDAGAGFDG